MRASLRTIGAALLAACVACRAVEEPVLPPAWTQADAARPLTHADCVRLALASAPNAAAWRARALAARAALDQAGRLPNPELELSWEELDVFGNSDRPLQQTFSLAYAFDALAARGRKKAAASWELAAEEARLAGERLALATEVRGAYDELANARARVALERELAAVAREERDALAAFLGAGLAARIDVERADAELAGAQRDLARAAADARAEELQLAFALGFERPVALELAERATPDSPGHPDVTTLLGAAAERRPELAAARARYAAELERLHLEAARPRFLPRLGAGYRTESGDPSAVATIGVELPLFDTGEAAVAAGSAALLAAAAELRRTAHDVAAEVCRAHAELRAARERDLDTRALAERRGALRTATEALFRAGQADFRDVLQARRDEVEARRALLEAEREICSARVRLDAAIGAPPSAEPEAP